MRRAHPRKMDRNLQNPRTTDGRGRRALVGGAALALAAALVLPAGTGASAGHGAAPASVYSGFAHGTTLHVDAVTSGTTRVANVDVGLANAAVGSAGMAEAQNAYKRIIRPAKADKHSHALSRIAEVGLVSNPSADGQIQQFDARVDAPPKERVEKVALNQNISAVAHIDLARNVAEGNWNDDSCVIGGPIALASEHLARVEAIETGDDPTTAPPSGFDKPVVGIDSVRQGPQRAATHTLAREDLFAAEGGTFGLRSFVHTTLAPVTFLQGTPNEFTIEADGPAFLEVKATGRPGGATATFKAPILTVLRGNDVLAQVPSSPIRVAVPAANPNDVVAEIEIATMKPIPAARGGIDGNVGSPDGTHAAAQAHVVQVRILDLPSANFTGATVALGHMEAAAIVPAGGITCPIPVTKTAEPSNVSIGNNFVTTINVHNPFDCELTNVVINDAISNVNPDNGQVTNARFQVVSGAPAPASPTLPTGTNQTNAQVTWNGGPIPPGESRSVAVTLLAQGAAGIISDIASVTGTLANCPAGPGVDQANVLGGPVRVDVPLSGRSAPLKVPTVQVLGIQVPNTLPKTGAANAPLAGGLIAAAAIGGRFLLNAFGARRRSL